LAETLADLEVDDVLAFNASRLLSELPRHRSGERGSAAMFVTRKLVE
jgi:hypothetical protein